MSTPPAVVVGGAAPDTIKLLEAVNRSAASPIVIEGILDDDVRKHGSKFMGYPILGPIRLLETRWSRINVINNIARDMKTRHAVVARLTSIPSVKLLTLVHPSVDTGHCTIGQGCLIQEGVVLGAGSTVGDHCVLYAGCVVGHETSLGELVFVANKAIVGARTTVGDGAFVGLGSIVLPYVEVGAWSTIGAGSIVLRNVDPGAAVFGNPARAGVRPTHLRAEAS